MALKRGSTAFVPWALRAQMPGQISLGLHWDTWLLQMPSGASPGSCLGWCCLLRGKSTVLCCVNTPQESREVWLNPFEHVHIIPPEFWPQIVQLITHIFARNLREKGLLGLVWGFLLGFVLVICFGLILGFVWFGFFCLRGVIPTIKPGDVCFIW